MTVQIPVSVIYLVRHAEKVSDYDENSELSPQGHARARRLAALLRDQAIDRVYVTALERTLQTAAPLIAIHQPEVRTLSASPAFLTAAAQELTALPDGTHTLVVTHVQYLAPTLALLGVPVVDLRVDGFDHLFVIHRVGTRANLLRLRYA